MKVFKWNPPEDSGFTGTVEIEVPNYRERVEMVQAVGINDDAANNLETSGKMLDLVEKQVKSVDVMFFKTAFKSLEDLGYSKEGMALINQIGLIIMGGMPLGNGS